MSIKISRLWPAFLLAFIATNMLLATSASAAPTVTAWRIFKFPTAQPGCTGVGLGNQKYWNRTQCGFVDMTISDGGVNIASTSTVSAEVLDEDGNFVASPAVDWRSDTDEWEFTFMPDEGGAWPAGNHCVRVTNINGVAGNYGESCAFGVNVLGADIAVTGAGFSAGDPIAVSGRLYQIDELPGALANQPPNLLETDVAASFKIQTELPNGMVTYTSPVLTALGDGTFSHTIPASASNSLTSTTNLAIRVIDATYSDVAPPLGTGDWGAIVAGSTNATINFLTAEVTLRNSFVTSRGWVKPGDSYTWRVFVDNATGSAITNAQVTIPAPDGTTFSQATPLAGAGSVIVSGSSLTWTI